MDVFVNQPDADEKTPLENNPHYAGSFGIFGVGKHAAGHGAGRAEPPKKTVRVLNLTRAMGQFAPARATEGLNLKFVVTDMEGRSVNIKKLPLKSFSLHPE